MALLAKRLPTCVSWQLSRDPHVALAGLQAVYGADVVQASAGHIVPRRSVGARHHPGRAQRDGMHLGDAMSRGINKNTVGGWGGGEGSKVSSLLPIKPYTSYY